MNSKERVMCAVAVEQPDKTPCDFAANPATLERLEKDLGCDTHKGLLNTLGADIVDLRGVVDPEYCGPVPQERRLDDGVVENFWGWRTKSMDTATGEEECFCDFVLGECNSVEELEQHRWPSPDWFDFSNFGERLTEWKGFAVMASGASIWQHPSFLRGLDRLLMDLVMEPEMAEFLLDKFTNFYLDYFDRMFTAAAGHIDLFRIADDLGMQDRLLISPDLFSQYIAPRLTRLVDMAHSHGVKVMFHSCGAIVPLINGIIDTGVDILDPIQVTATGMDAETLKQEYGDRICLHGAIDTQYLLPEGSPADVTKTAKKMIKTLGADGGFILAPCHVLQTDVPTDNIVALYEAV
ncbi:MAG: uroporphyrinogen decarboxylase family protein [Candidatus Brocadiia bacterium]